ncbi:hypothetical protein [Microbacterium sp.]|uniref:hypothetical protein n=1 Tax=Microbacterium sp. TaxID=51671 RepID=UPI003A8CE16A
MPSPTSSRSADAARACTPLADAVDAAREWAASSDRRAVVIAGSIVLAGEALLPLGGGGLEAGWRA